MKILIVVGLPLFKMCTTRLAVLAVKGWLLVYHEPP